MIINQKQTIMHFTTLYKNIINLILLIVLISFSTKINAENFNPVINLEDTSKTKIDSLNNELPGPVFYTGINFNKFKFKIKRFITIPENKYNNAVITTKQNYFEPYYEGKPFTSGMNNFVYINQGNDISKISKELYLTYKDKNAEPYYYPENQVIKLPKSIIYYLDEYKVDENNRIILDNISENQLKKVLKPFYFSKFEVSIEEYKEFTTWVRKTNGFDNLPYHITKIEYFDKTKNDSLSKNKLVWTTPKEKAYSYSFYKPNEEITNEFGNKPICVVPCDTIELYYPNKNADFGFFDVNIFYNKEEKYLQYPVMGISYYQALAFLDWKQHFHQKYLDKTYANVEVKYELPNLIDYDLVLNNIKNYSSINWLCDLQLSKQSNQRTSLDKLLNNKILYSEYDTTKNTIFENTISEINVASAVLDYNKQKKYTSKAKHILLNDIEWLDGNVSEWMSDSYKDNWLPAYNIHKGIKQKNDADKLTLAIEDYFNNKNDKNGHLVMGGNYIDYRQSMVYTDINTPEQEFNKAGVNLKKFVNPKAQYSTIGFRYVIRVVVKNEEKKDSLLRMAGTFDYNRYADFPTDYNKYFSKYYEEDITTKIDSVEDWKFDINTLKGKMISKGEITNGMWRRFIIDYIEEGNIDTALLFMPKDSLWVEHNDLYRYYFKDLQFDDYPVVNISFDAVKEFNKWVTLKNNAGELLSKFYLLNENEWVKIAATGRKDTSYAFNINKIKEFRFQDLANVKTTLTDSIYDYIIKNLYKYSNSDSLVIKYKDIPNSMAKAIYNGSYIGRIKYNKFLEKEFIFKKYTSLSPLSADNLKNKIGLRNLHGNVAEMIDTSIIIKGGSWNNYMEDCKLTNSEKWDGTASPMVGFRLAMDLPEKIDSLMLIKIMSRIPPGTVLLTPEFGVDVLEMRNIDYFRFMKYTEQIYGKNSSQYKRIIPDKTVWKSYDFNGQDLSNLYFSDNNFLNHPLVGVSYDQAVLYCEWRTEYINNFYDLYHMKYIRSIGVPKRLTYRLPTPEEWDRILTTDSIFMPDDGFIHPNFTNPVKDQDAINKRISKGLTSSVFYFWKNKIGIYAFDDNVSEMTSEPGVARGCNWTGGKENTNCHYEQPENWVGFRCVVDVEY